MEAGRYWRRLQSEDLLHLAQQFTFVFHCPTERMALGLLAFLRSTSYAGFVRTTDRAAIAREDVWPVAGTTHGRVWALPSLEHLFMHLRRAGARYESTLISLDLVPISGCFV